MEYYSKTAVFADITDTPGLGVMQGMAARSVYIYTIKINKAITKAGVFRTKIATGETTRLIDSDTGLDYNTYLGHGGDVATATIDDLTNLYVMDKDIGLVKLEVNGSVYRKVANYRIMLDGSVMPMVAVARISYTDSQVTLLFKKGNTFYKGSVGTRDGSKDINVTKVFSIDRKNVLVNGKAVPNIEQYIAQGIEYTGGKLYITLWGGEVQSNDSIILVYDNVLAASSLGKTLTASDVSFRITSKLYYKYEIEGCSISGGKMYLSANRTKTLEDKKNTPICYFTDYMG